MSDPYDFITVSQSLFSCWYYNNNNYYYNYYYYY